MLFLEICLVKPAEHVVRGNYVIFMSVWLILFFKLPREIPVFNENSEDLGQVLHSMAFDQGLNSVCQGPLSRHKALTG